jgi:two-component system chemotaxis response regulator CheY
VVEAVDGQDALEKSNSRDFDLVLTDQNMPRMDGITLTRNLRNNPKFKTTPILILTTESSDQMKQAGRSAGATGWLVKPFDPAKLIEVMKMIVTRAENAMSGPGMQLPGFTAGERFSFEPKPAQQLTRMLMRSKCLWRRRPFIFCTTLIFVHMNAYLGFMWQGCCSPV